MYDANLLIHHLRASSVGRDDSVFALTPGAGTLTFGDLFDQAERIAAALVAAGLAPGDRVAAQIQKSTTALALYLGTVMAGGVFLPLNTAYTDAEMTYFLGDAQPRVLVCDPSTVIGLGDIAQTQGVRAVFTLGSDGTGTLTEASARTGSGFTPVPRGRDDLAAMLYTSGTTGRSKGAMLSHGNLVSNALALAEVWRFSQTDVLIHALPIFHTHGLFVATNVSLVSGASLVFLPAFDPDAIIAALPQATVLMGVPTFYVRLLDHPSLTAAAVAGMRLFISGSAPLLAETHARWKRATGHAILERYGMTETNMNTSNPYDGPRIAGTVGLALPGIEVRVCDPATGKPLPSGQVGSIEIRGPNVFKGYWQMPEKTAAEFRQDGFFISGDLGSLDAAGYLTIVGRSKDLIISGGYNIYPKEVEDAIDSIPGVLESAVIGLAHADLGEVVAAVVVLAKDAELTEAAIFSRLQGQLARFKQPRALWFAPSLPRNAMGKVLKNVLRDKFSAASRP